MEIVSSKWIFYSNYFYNLGAGYISNLGHDFRMSLMKPTYVPNNLLNKSWNDISSNEIVAYSYPIGGISLSGKQFYLNETEEAYYWSANDVIFYLGELVDVKYIVIYNNSPLTKPLVCWAYIDNSQVTVNGANFKINVQNIYKIYSEN